MQTTDVSFRVRYAETDKMGIVYHANYLVWLEIGRTELLRQRGFVYRELEEQYDCHIVVANVSCTYRAPARYDDLITVRTGVKSVRSRVVIFDYEVFHEDGRRLATAETTHVVTDHLGKPRVLPDPYRRALEDPLVGAGPRE